MRIPCEGPTYIYANNKSVLSKATFLDSTLSKKLNCIACHFVREVCPRDEWRTAYINTHESLTDLLTKTLPSGEKRTNFANLVLYYVTDEVE